MTTVEMDCERHGLVYHGPDESAPASCPKCAEEAAGAHPARREDLRVAVDFDGVLHSYRSGWKGAAIIPDAPVDGAIPWLCELARRAEVFIYSARNSQAGGIAAIRFWLERWGVDADALQIRVVADKPRAHVYVDDRGFRFEGAFPSVDDLLQLRDPWWKRLRKQE